MLQIQPFLTAYDPSDLPGGSIDPLGFERGYLFLADKILPGLTNVANRPRYFSMLAAAIVIADDNGNAGHRNNPRERYQWRLQLVTRQERLWTLANVLAAENNPEEEFDLSGLRGVRYVRARTAFLRERGAAETDADFRLLSRQVAYGAVGIYGTVADGLRILDRDTLAPTPDLGVRLGEAFLEETRMPTPFHQAVALDRPVRITDLSRWGERAHMSVPTQQRERRCFWDALELHATRWRTVQLLAQHPAMEGESELDRLARIGRTLNNGAHEPDLAEAIRAIVAYERCYRLVLLAFVRMLWTCQSQAPFWIERSTLSADSVLSSVLDAIPPAVGELSRALDESETDAFRADLSRVRDVQRFLSSAAERNDIASLVKTLLDRHAAVQHGKVDAGRPKMPWLESSGNRIMPTLGRALHVDKEPRIPLDVAPHGYRTWSADALLTAAGMS
ncbi:MAG: hypothetical protein MUF54_02825 [Polyangiaceae bacterium]|nr:hypothetical protein [Polyangiaceae bacterium]